MDARNREMRRLLRHESPPPLSTVAADAAAAVDKDAAAARMARVAGPNACDGSERSRLEEEMCNAHFVPECDLRSRYRTFDGTCNNPAHPTLGAANTLMDRILPASYRDGIGVRREYSVVIAILCTIYLRIY